MKNKKILVDMSATIIHHGHIRLLKKASKYGKVVVALTKDNEVKYTRAKFWFDHLEVVSSHASR